MWIYGCVYVCNCVDPWLCIHSGIDDVHWFMSMHHALLNLYRLLCMFQTVCVCIAFTYMLCIALYTYNGICIL